MKWLILAGLVAWAGVAGAQTPADVFTQEIKSDLFIAETVGEAYGCGFRSDYWAAFTLNWLETDVWNKAKLIWPIDPSGKQPPYAAFASSNFDTEATKMYRLGLLDTSLECSQLNADGILPLVDLRTGYVP
jgi:hypothetical protein